MTNKSNAEICESVCNILKSRSDLLSQQRKDISQEIKSGSCSQDIINRKINLDGKSEVIANIVINLDKQGTCKCNF